MFFFSANKKQMYSQVVFKEKINYSYKFHEWYIENISQFSEAALNCIGSIKKKERNKIVFPMYQCSNFLEIIW